MRAICPKCNSSHVRKRGVIYSKGFECNLQRYVCVTCKKWFQVPRESPKVGIPKILLFDIETAPMEVYVWTTSYKQFIPHTNIIKDENGEEKSWYVLSWAAKWLYDENVISDIVTPKETKTRDDKRILKSIWKLLDEAEIVIGHNGDRFAFVSNKQDYLTKHFKLEQKLSTNFQLWVDCIHGDQEQLNKMEEYNRHDVMGLEEVYLKLRPYIKNHPNLGVLVDADVCPNCACEFLDETNTEYFTSANKFPVYRCQGCNTPYIRHKKNSNYVQTNMRSVPK